MFAAFSVIGQTAFSFYTRPQNAAVIGGYNVTLLCSVSPPATIIWKFIPWPYRTEANVVNIVLDSSPTSGYEDRFAVQSFDSEQASTRNLVVMGATSNDAGIYICEHFDQTERRYSELIVLGKSSLAW